MFDGLGQQLDINASFALPAVCVGAHKRQSLGVRVMVDSVEKTSAAVSLQFAERGGALIPPYNVSAVVWVDMTQSGSNATKGRTQAPLDLAAAVGSSSSLSGMKGLLGEQEDAVARFPLRILVDRSVIEVYAQDGITVLSALMFPTSSRNSGVELFAENMGCEVDVTAQIFGMGSAYVGSGRSRSRLRWGWPRTVTFQSAHHVDSDRKTLFLCVPTRRAVSAITSYRTS